MSIVLYATPIKRDKKMAETNTQQTAKLPTVRWAQRADCLLLAIEIPNAKVEDITTFSNKLSLKCRGEKGDLYELDTEFYGEVNPEVRDINLGRNINLVIEKKEAGPYWPRLTKDSKKQHWLHTDFSRWKDEDESDDELPGGGGGGRGDDRGLNEMLANMGGGMGGMPGMGGMGGMGGMPGMGGMGGMGGMPGMGGMGGMAGMPGMGGMAGMGGMPGMGDMAGMEGLNMGEDDDDSDDEPIPDLEETEPQKDLDGRSE